MKIIIDKTINTVYYVYADRENLKQIKIGMDIKELIVEANLATSKSEARRFIQSGAFRINDKKVLDTDARICYDSEYKAFFVFTDETYLASI